MWIDELSNHDGVQTSCTAMHATMISHWAMMFNAPISDMIINFSATPSIAIPMLTNIPPPPIVPAATPDFPHDDDNNDWEFQLVDTSTPIPVPPPQHHIHNEHDIIGPNHKPITPTDPIPSMPSSPPQFLQVNLQDPAPPFEQIVNTLIQHDVDAQVERATREEEEEGQTPSPTGPQPNVHLGPSWHVNFEEDAIHYVFQIPLDDGRYEIAHFIMINWNMMSPELLGMRGQCCKLTTLFK